MLPDFPNLRTGHVRLPLGLMMLVAAILSGCASPSTRISTSLQRYGLDETRAQCVGDRLQAKLSLGQLKQLGHAAQAYQRNDMTPGRLGIDDLVRVAAAINDPLVASEVARATIDCDVPGSVGR